MNVAFWKPDYFFRFRWAWPPPGANGIPPQDSPQGVGTPQQQQQASTPSGPPGMVFSNYYDMFRQVDQPMFYDPRQSQPGFGASYLQPKSAQKTPQLALGAFLPMRLPRASPQVCGVGFSLRK